MISIRLNNILLVSKLVSFYLLLSIIYVTIISNYYAYTGFLLELSIIKIISVIFVFTSIIILVQQLRLDNLTNFFIHLIIIFQLTPALIFYSFNNVSFKISVAYLIYILFLCFFPGKIGASIKQVIIPNWISRYFLTILMVALILPFVVVYFPYLNLKNLLLIDIYETRDVQKSINNLYFSYTYTWISKIILPVLLLISLEYKKYLLTIVVIICTILMFLVGAHKSVLFGNLIVIFFYFGTHAQKLKRILRLLNILIILSLITYILFDNYYIVSLIFRRVFFIPTLIESYYFEFFENNFVYWSNSVLSFVNNYPFELSIPNKIGMEYFGDKSMSANNGIISEGYAQFGFIGVFINILGVSIILFILKGLKIKSKYYGIIFLVFFTFLSSAFLTSLITHGILLLVLICFLFLNRTEDAK